MVSNTRKVFSFMDKITIDDVFWAVVLTTLTSSDNRALRAAYNQIIDDLDDAKELTLDSIQTA